MQGLAALLLRKQRNLPLLNRQHHQQDPSMQQQNFLRFGFSINESGGDSLVSGGILVFFQL